MRTLALLIVFFGSIGRSSARSYPVGTSDLLYWKYAWYVMSVSPVKELEGYLSIYSEIPSPDPFEDDMSDWFAYPLVIDKNYSVFWKIEDSTLYAVDLNFFTLKDWPLDYHKYFKPDPNKRFKALENLTGSKFDRTIPASRNKPSGPYGVMAATWFSGDLFIKEKPNRKTDVDDWYLKYPIFRLTFESGKLKKIGRERAMTVIPNSYLIPISKEQIEELEKARSRSGRRSILVPH